MKLQNMTLLAAALVLSAGAAQAANFAGGSSNTGYVAVGASTVNGGPHTAGNAGVAVNSTGLGNPVDFQGLTAYSTQSPANVDWNRDGVADGTSTVYGLNFPYSGAPTTHDNLGVFSFAKVGSQDVWFGEWNARKDTADGVATHTVYYIGNNADTSVPSTGTATYNVAGINNFSGSNLLSGQFTADFGTRRLSGTIANSAGYSVNIGLATINADASISGRTAVARQGTGIVASGGAVSGQFYSSQTALAGMARFTNNQYDTAFGGTKN